MSGKKPKQSIPIITFIYTEKEKERSTTIKANSAEYPFCLFPGTLVLTNRVQSHTFQF